MRRGQRLCAVGINIIIEETQEVAGEKKSGHLTAAVLQRLVNFHHTIGDREHVVCRFAFLKDQAMRPGSQRTYNGRQAPAVVRIERAASRNVVHRACFAWIGTMRRMRQASRCDAELRHGNSWSGPTDHTVRAMIKANSLGFF